MLEIKDILKKWDGILEVEGAESIQDRERKEACAIVLENTAEHGVGQERTGFLSEESGSESGDVAGYDPVLISMVRRTMPSLIAFDIAGVQPMRQPTGKVFAMRNYYTTNQTPANEAFYQEAPRTDFSGRISTQEAERLGGNVGVDTDAGGVQVAVSPTPWPEMSLAVDSITVSAESRALKATYTDELMQDLKAQHGLNADVEISRMLVSEIRAEMNRELIDTINAQAVQGAVNTTTAGIFDMAADTTGRWQVETYKELMVFIYREAAQVARECRRGQANFIITSPDVAAAIVESSKLDTSFATQNLSFDGIGVTFAGILAGRYKLYIDAYAPSNYITLGYKGTEKYDAGIFWCPYVGIERKESRRDADFQPQIGYKTRYAITHNPLASGANGGNVYFRRFEVVGL